MPETARPLVRERDGFLIYEVEQLESFVSAAVKLPQATHFAAAGSRDIVKWFHPAARTREAPFLDRPEAHDDQLVACRLDAVARESVRRFVLKASTKSDWAGACLWHLWLYSDDHIVLSAYDWGQYPVFIDPDLESWAQQLQAKGALGERLSKTPY